MRFVAALVVAISISLAVWSRRWFCRPRIIPPHQHLGHAVLRMRRHVDIHGVDLTENFRSEDGVRRAVRVDLAVGQEHQAAAVQRRQIEVVQRDDHRHLAVAG